MDKAAVIAIGSELLAGQITNRNAAWLSARLFELGIATDHHVTVDDVEDDIVGALEAAARRAQILIVTGGLGPTSDDLTRQAVARFAGKQLVFDPGSWTHIEAIFARFGGRTPESNRQQCYFPEGARVLTNMAGTANGFAMIAGGVRIFVLPGPPIEVERVWNDHVLAELTNAVPPAERRVVKMWRTIGRGESHLAEVVEKVIAGHGVDVAYRAHQPFVETKVRFLATDLAKHAGLIASLDAALAPWLFEVDAEDVTTALVARCAAFPSINIYDGASRGHLAEQLAGPLRAALPKAHALSLASSWEEHDSPAMFVRNCLTMNDDVALGLAVAGFDENGGWAVGVRHRDGLTVMEKASPYKGEALQTRNWKAVAWLAMRAWHEMLAAGLH